MSGPASPRPAGHARRRIAVFASGGGSNFAALLEYLAALPDPPAQAVLLVTDRRDAGALRRAADGGIPTAHLADPADGPHILGVLDQYRVDLIVLAGYLRLVPEAVVRRFHGAMLNIHPALLPRHGGRGMYGSRVHRAVLAAGDSRSGATVHFVDAAYDRGAAIAWAEVAVVPGDTPESLAARVLAGEHFVLPRVVDAVARDLVALVESDVDVRAGAAALFTSPPPGVIVRLAHAAAPR